MTEPRKIKRALISVSDKTGLLELAAALAAFGVEIISTGGTARALRENGIDVTDVSSITGFPEMMDGRVKTLHPKIHGALLALRDNPDHIASMNEHDIEPIDLVVVNLYPFDETIKKDGVTLDEAVENIDIGGPAMIRSAAKNWRDVAVVTDARLYDYIIHQMWQCDGCLPLETRQCLATIAYLLTSRYDSSISAYIGQGLSEEELEQVEPFDSLRQLFERTGQTDYSEPVKDSLPEWDSIELSKLVNLRYGENPHQRAALYESDEGGGIAGAEQHHGKEMSFNNYVDAEAAWSLVQDFDTLAVAIVKHTNPSGVGVGKTNEDAYRLALATDPVSAFGGIVAFNRKVDATVAAAVNKVFTEVVIAPDFDQDALEIFRTKKNLRILLVAPAPADVSREYKQISGGFLVQDRDVHRLTTGGLNFVTDRQPNDTELRSMLLAWTVCKHVKSNAIVFANEHQTLGVGAGQMNRVDSVRIAAMRAERFDLVLRGSALASDAFFPFRDNVDEAAKYGVTAIIQPGGSIKDDESIAAANEHGIAMAFTGIRHFKH